MNKKLESLLLCYLILTGIIMQSLAPEIKKRHFVNLRKQSDSEIYFPFTYAASINDIEVQHSWQLCVLWLNSVKSRLIKIFSELIL